MPVCELCGKTEFVKEDSMFVCQGCGTKYTLEEAKKLEQSPANAVQAGGTTATSAAASSAPSAVDVVGSVAVAAITTLIEALNKTGEFTPNAVGSEIQDVRSVNNYICQGWQAIVDEYKRKDHPTLDQLQEVVARAKESLQALDNAAMAEPEKYVQNTLIYNNCIAIEDSVNSLHCYEQKDGEWKRVSFPIKNSDLKIPGQKDSWKEKRAIHQEQIEQEYLGANESEVTLRAELTSQAEKIQAQLDELKDEKKSKGFFNFAEKGEVKERMKPVKEELAALNSQIRDIDKRVSNYVDERLSELGKSFTQLSF